MPASLPRSQPPGPPAHELWGAFQNTDSPADRFGDPAGARRKPPNPLRLGVSLRFCSFCQREPQEGAGCLPPWSQGGPAQGWSRAKASFTAGSQKPAAETTPDCLSVKCLILVSSRPWLPTASPGLPQWQALCARNTKRLCLGSRGEGGCS